MRNRIKTTAAATAAVAGLTGLAIAGGFSVANADPGDGPGTSTEWCDEYNNLEGWNTEDHAQFHDQMESHMGDFMRMGTGMRMGMNNGFDVDGMDAGSGMGEPNMGRGSFMGR